MKFEWKWEDKCPCVSQVKSYEKDYETLMDKQLLSSRVLLQYLDLIADFDQCVDKMPDEQLERPLRFLYETNKLFHQYCVEWVEVNPWRKMDYTDIKGFKTILDIKSHMSTCKDINIFLIRVIKRSLHLPKLKNPKAQDIIYMMLRRINRIFEDLYLTYLW